MKKISRLMPGRWLPLFLATRIKSIGRMTDLNKVFRGIGNLIEKKPLRTLLIAIVIFSAFIAGVSNMMMATGNETLVQSDNEVFLSNKQMEDSFGGDSILVLFTEETQGSLFTLENIRKMWNVEQRFQYEEDIFHHEHCKHCPPNDTDAKC